MTGNIEIGEINRLLEEILNPGEFTSLSILVDENTKKHCLPILKLPLGMNYRVIEITSGENNKNLNTCEQIWGSLTENNVDRGGLLVNLGGGVIGDMGGFCAATYKRGISFINIPTTLLSMVDASIGGKLGVDFHNLKNHIGLFKEPDFVLIDPVFLNTLPENQVKSGFAEIVKHALIKDNNHWDELKNQDWKSINWTQIIRKSIKIKTFFVSEDFRESGPRKSLNFGHTIGHAIESLLLDTPYEILHGEGVIAGIITESYLSYKLNYISEDDLNDITNCLISRYKKVFIPINSMNGLKKLMYQDKKNKDKTIMFTLLKKKGEAIWDCEVPGEMLEEAMNFYDQIYT